MDSADAKNIASTRTLRLGYTLGHKNLKSLKDNSFSSTYSLLQQNNDNEASTKREVNEQNDTPVNLWERFNARTITEMPPAFTGDSHNTVRDIQTVKQQFVLYLWRILFGDESAKKLQEKYGINDLNQANSSENMQNQTYGNSTDIQNVITLYGIKENYYMEEQNTSFSSNGTIRTADGRTIDFALDISMSSRFESYYREESLDAIKMCDPLVLNFTGDVADLSDQKFFFDLDADGKEEEISMLSSGNGFLAYDKNNDGIINDGSELFGAKSGNGFADLEIYDYDKNGWIDENDAIFDKLKIWTKNEDGTDALVSLKDKGIGAIYLGNSNTDFTLRDSGGQTTGAIRKTGIFLYENATLGTMVHLDIANQQAYA